ncbi:hypothetical protein J5N97_013838 [Dioscorea zingiberensis]|uniref:Uncharacterized protein n=1 Tax=Dioscorea zingiberensis TaxID=325984 RepID=A0A9D5HJ31_9LILI|nr:hypothetical protein J5N97_013838 [Dioscorea zingiberensis]
MDGGQWSSESRKGCNLRDAVNRCTVQVGPFQTKNPWGNPKIKVRIHLNPYGIAVVSSFLLIEDDSKDTDSSEASWPALPANCAVKTSLPERWSDEHAFRVPQISAMNAEKHKRARTMNNNSTSMPSSFWYY